MAIDTMVAARVPAQRDPERERRVAAAGGDREVFAALVAEHLRPVYRFVRSRVRTRQEAEDITQQTALRALAAAHQYRTTDHAFGAWLVTIARNLLADYWKSAHYQRSTPTDTWDLDVAAGVDPADAATAGETAEVVRAALVKLTVGQRRVLELRFWRGLNIAETAEVMGTTTAAVKVLQYRAVLALGRLPTMKALDPARPGGGADG